jgi:hypothetical protein
VAICELAVWLRNALAAKTHDNQYMLRLPSLVLCPPPLPSVLQVGFVAIRELAVLLRNALAAKTQDAHKEVYCWQVGATGRLFVRLGVGMIGARVQRVAPGWGATSAILCAVAVAIPC